jgi:transposase-like protein
MPLEPWANSRTPALAIVARGDQIAVTSATEFRVSSQSRPGVAYRVSALRGHWSCECPFFSQTGRWCIHIQAIRLRDGFERPARDAEEPPECERCRSALVVRFGVRRNKSGPVSRYRCSACGYSFSGREGFHRRRTDPERIALALDLFFRGLSVRKITDHFHQVYGLRVSPMTVYRWLAHYSELAVEWMSGLEARTGERWHVDETVIQSHGAARYLWNVMDADSRFLLATHVSRSRGLRDARAPLRKAISTTPDRPMEVFSDGMNAYPSAVRRELGYRSGSEIVNPHHRVKSIRAKPSKNLVERLHGTEKERTKTMRGFGNDAGASMLMEGFRVHYNLVRPHQSLGTTPAVAAGLPDVGGFRWKEIILQASRGIPAGQAELVFIVT